MPNIKYVLWMSLFFVCYLNGLAQRERDTIKPEKLIITKQYNPSVNDAFKIKKQPRLSDSILPKPKTLTYSILDVPVASTFTPAKGRAGGLRLQPDNIDAYTNYARIGAGNFTSVLAEFYSQVALNANQKIDLGLSHFSSQGGIDEVVLDDDFMTNELNLNFTSEEKSLVWKLSGGLTYNRFNYYGVNEDLIFALETNHNDISQNYLGFNLGGDLEFYKGVFKKITFDYSNFSDNFDSQENRFKIQPQIDFFIGDQRIENFVKFDYLAGDFSNLVFPAYNYAWAITSYNPNLQINEDRFSLKLGAEVAFLSDIENSETEFYVYPKVEGNYQINQDNLIAFGGVDGGLDQNSYQSFSTSNPFVSPTFPIAPTNRQYDAYLGLKGGSYAWSYNAKVSFTSQENNPFFSRLNPQFVPNEVFTHDNSFQIIYDALTTTAIDVEIDYSINNKINVGVEANYSAYDTEVLASAFNLPNTRASVFANYKMNDQWKFGASVFYVGERDDLQVDRSLQAFGTPEVITLDSFVDANFTAQYKINSQLHAFVEAKNLFGGNYERWLAYPVQDFQILGGISFQFDW
ncbi:TonB-dependent receptor [Psychroflexus salis]|uniref:TonB-dependent receptor n=1 Tax=Psychroflexus salis TaxID=1526574 RepID=A0A916ZQ33_9FLAO|nr:TonB-dependent receptor [Psychroflexus salis]GGE07503.1 hypothetical protein GCM10010831_06280 [Psychroflexus salis]